MAKKIQGYLRLQCPAGQATPSPPIGPALGQRGLNIMEFCKTFNAQTQNMEPGVPIPTVITVYVDKSFSIETKKPTAAYFLQKAAGVQKGAGEAGRTPVGSVTRSQLREIAVEKIDDLNANSVEAAMHIIAGSARSMGIEVRD